MIITIGRQHGSNGHVIARRLAEELGYRCYDKEIVEQAAERSGFSKEILSSYDERKVSNYVVATPHYIGMSEGFRLNMQITSAQFDTIRSLAEQGSAIFVGRCADYILQDRPDCLHFFIHAPLQQRVERAVKVYGLAPDKAEDLVKKIDRRRATYYNYYTSMRFGDAGNYNLSVNSLSLGIENTVSLLERYIELADWK